MQKGLGLMNKNPSGRSWFELWLYSEAPSEFTTDIHAEMGFITEHKSSVETSSVGMAYMEISYNINDLIVDHTTMVDEMIDIRAEESVQMGCRKTELMPLCKRSLETVTIDSHRKDEIKMDSLTFDSFNIVYKSNRDSGIENEIRFNHTSVETDSSDKCFIDGNDKAKSAIDTYLSKSESILTDTLKTAQIDTVDIEEVEIDIDERKVVLYDS